MRQNLTRQQVLLIAERPYSFAYGPMFSEYEYRKYKNNPAHLYDGRFPKSKIVQNLPYEVSDDFWWIQKRCDNLLWKRDPEFKHQYHPIYDIQEP